MRREYLIPIFLLLTSCSSVQEGMYSSNTGRSIYPGADYNPATYANRLPTTLDTKGQKVVFVDPNVHAWGAYDSHGKLVRAGIASAGGRNCPPDADEADCRTSHGRFRISSIGGEDCYSKTYPRPNGGGLMPYCMYFNGGQALHGSPASIVTENNESHGCVRMMIPDAEWMVKHFAQVGTRVVVAPY